MEKIKFGFVILCALGMAGCLSKYTIKTEFVNKSTDAETRIIQTEYTQKGTQTQVFAFYQKTLKFVNDEMLYRRK